MQKCNFGRQMLNRVYFCNSDFFSIATYHKFASLILYTMLATNIPTKAFNFKHGPNTECKIKLTVHFYLDGEVWRMKIGNYLFNSLLVLQLILLYCLPDGSKVNWLWLTCRLLATSGRQAPHQGVLNFLSTSQMDGSWKFKFNYLINNCLFGLFG